MPKIIRGANEYYNKSLWRYWSPPTDNCYVFSRSFIFLLSQTCLDAKTLIHNSFENLGIRPVRLNNLKIDLEIEAINKSIRMRYKSEYDNDYTEIYKADNFIE